VAEIDLPVGGEVSGIMFTLKPVGRLEVKAKNAASRAGIDQIAIRLERDGAPNRWIAGTKRGDLVAGSYRADPLMRVSGGL